MGKHEFVPGESVKHPDHRDETILEGHGPMPGECSILVGPKGARKRFIIKIADLDVEEEKEIRHVHFPQ